MMNLRHIGAALVCAVSTATWTAPAPAGAAASMGVSHGRDLDALFSTARGQIGLAGQDAVLLIEGRHVAVGTNGGRRTRVHRAVWIGTAMGIRDHADLRVPYNSDTSTLTVTALRTWRDDRWWPDATQVSPTAVVETLPFELAQADDYTGMRETMLLHDGVELPCIMETAWEIEERATPGKGNDGLWVFSQRDPAVRVEFALTVRAGERLVFRCGNGAPDPVVTREGDGSTTYTWTMENVERLGSPPIADPASYAPYVSWSTWESWEALGESIVSSFDEAAVLSDELADTLSGRLAHEPSAGARARSVAAFVEEATRNIHYDSRFWGSSARPASRTWETAYGHDLDRAVLAAALFRRAGFDARPVYRSIGPGGVDLEIPGLTRFAPIAVRATGDGVDVFYNPSEGRLIDGALPLFDRVVWNPGTEGRPSPGTGLRDPEATSRFTLAMTIEPDDEGNWTGTGFLRADGWFSPYADMAGLHGETLSRLGNIAGSVLAGSTVETFNAEVFTRDEVVIGFALEMKAPEDDGRGRVGVTTGEPSGGILSRLQADVHLYDENRTSPVTIAAGMTQRITLRLKTAGRDIAHLPEALEVENEAGRYSLSVEHADGWVTVERELTLKAGTIQPKAWPKLRALLLEEGDSAGRTVLIE